MKVSLRNEFQRPQGRQRWRQCHYCQRGGKSYGKNCLKRITRLMLMEMILQKEKDLELAAKIGQSLLEQNHDLQTRNEFLEEALNTSNDMVIQLRHDLQTRSNLLRFYIDYDVDFDGCTAGHSNSEKSQQKIKRLEDENESLKEESINLKKIVSEFEENERLHISEWTKQLDAANEKISHLQRLLAEKTEECGSQSVEVERLIREIAQQSISKKALKNETVNLEQQLQYALTMHEELTAKVIDLQERHTEVLAMLRDTEEELRTYRQNQCAYRTSSPDSLYDSLASEIEASDSHFYNATKNQKQENVQSVTNVSRLLNNSEAFKLRILNDDSNVSKTRTVATVTDPIQSDRDEQTSRSDDNVVDVPNHVVEKILRRSRLPHLSKSMERNNSADCSISDQLKSKPLSITKPEAKLFNIDASASTSTSGEPGQLFDRNKDSSQYPTWLMYNFNPLARHQLSSSKSNDSLSDYEGPQMGEPGRPGTRDLDWCIEKLNIRKQIERNYMRFRRERGLLPLNASFLSTSSSSSQANSQMRKHQWSRVTKCGTTVPPEQKFTNDFSRVFKCDNISSNVGLFASLHNSIVQGIMLRSTIPVMPTSTTRVRQMRESLASDMPINSSYLLEALDLSTSSPKLLSKQLAEFHSMNNLHLNLSAKANKNDK